MRGFVTAFCEEIPDRADGISSIRSTKAVWHSAAASTAKTCRFLQGSDMKALFVVKRAKSPLSRAIRCVGIESISARRAESGAMTLSVRSNFPSWKLSAENELSIYSTIWLGKTSTIHSAYSSPAHESADGAKTWGQTAPSTRHRSRSCFCNDRECLGTETSVPMFSRVFLLRS